jgi:predicted DNA-binding protein (MmcQ/YjbR family)
MPKTHYQIAQEICLAFPEAEEFLSHGAPNFRVKKGKIFAIFEQNHHGSGRTALWVNSPPGAQSLWMDLGEASYFVPPYLGPRGWLGIKLDQNLPWTEVVERVVEAYRNTAPAKLHAQIRLPKIAATAVKTETPLLESKAAIALLKKLRAYCATLPETQEAIQFGNPVWQAGKRTYLHLGVIDNQLTIFTWVGLEWQNMLIEDPRYRIPPFMGHNGWIALNVHTALDWKEITMRIDESYQHFALKRMLAQWKRVPHT